MRLAATVYGSATDRPPLVIAHGLFGSARNWSAIGKRLAADRQVIAVDMRNHGDSPRSPDHSYRAMAGDLAETIAEHGGRADVLGHSMGGKAAMVLALTRADAVNRLIVADMAPVAYSHSQIDYVDAMRGVDLASVSRRSDADAALADAVPEPPLRAFLLQSLSIDPSGAAWKLNLDALADQMPAIMDFPDLEGTPSTVRRCSCPAAPRTTCARTTGPGSARSSPPRKPAKSPKPATGCTRRRPARSSRPSTAFSVPETLDARPGHC